MSPRPDVSEERREQIVDAAAKVFARRGFKDSRMDDIVKESGLSKGLLYWYFKNKDAVIEAVVRTMFESSIRRVKELPGMPGTAEERLRRFATESLAEIPTAMKFVPITVEFYGMAFRSKAFQRVFNEYGEAYSNAVSEVIQQGITAKEFQEVDPRSAALFTGAALEGTLLLWVLNPKAIDLPTQIASTVDLIMRSLLGNPTT